MTVAAGDNSGQAAVSDRAVPAQAHQMPDTQNMSGNSDAQDDTSVFEDA